MATLRELREQRHITREQLATAAEVAVSTIYNTEADRVTPRPAILRRMARALGVTVDDIDLGLRPRLPGLARDVRSSGESSVRLDAPELGVTPASADAHPKGEA